ncbi:MAG: peroxide stress protein YaaA [Jatrophihabitantaceae bacterium]
MRILLPPSEAKTSGGRGRAIARRGLTGPLAEPRATVLDALRSLITGEPAKAADALLLPAGVASEALAANAEVSRSATRPALHRYAGVVYDGLDLDRLAPEVQRQAGRRVLVFSGLWGVVRGDEPVPNYRVPAKAALPGVGVVGTFWRPLLDDALPRMLGGDLVVDLRSSDYIAMWRPRREIAERVVSVRVLSPLPRGGFGIVSYASKLAKGQLAAALLTRSAAGESLGSAGDVAQTWLGRGGAAAEVTATNHVDLYTSPPP